MSKIIEPDRACNSDDLTQLRFHPLADIFARGEDLSVDCAVLAYPPIIPNIAQRGDALDLLRSLPDACTPLVFFDPQHRAVLDRLKFGNEGARQRGRAELPAMSESYIDTVCRESARILKPGGYLMRWVDTFCLCESHHLRIVDVVNPVDLIAWDSLRPGMGKRTRRRGDYLLILQKPPINARTWRDHGIPNRWQEKVDRKVHPHIKPIGLITRLIAAVTEPGDLIVDPAAGSFTVLRAARRLGRNFSGCDLIVRHGCEGA
jgi:site-specific DNA-methyltransferase (adenine-specific)